MKNKLLNFMAFFFLCLALGVSIAHACGGSSAGCGCAGNSPKVETAAMKCPGSCMCSVAMPSGPKI